MRHPSFFSHSHIIRPGSGGGFGVRSPALFHVTAACRTRRDSFSSLIILTFAASAVTNPPPARRSLPRTAAAGINDGGAVERPHLALLKLFLSCKTSQGTNCTTAECLSRPLLLLFLFHFFFFKHIGSHKVKPSLWGFCLGPI